MPTDSTTNEDASKLSEGDYLKQEADRARAAISKTLADVKASLGRAADPHRLTHDHPYLAVGAAAIAGFAAVAALVPSRQQQAMHTLASIEKALRQPAATAETSRTEEKKEAAAGGWIGIVLAEILKLVRPLLTTLISSSLAGMGAVPADANGAATDADDATAGEQPAVSSPS